MVYFLKWGKYVILGVFGWEVYDIVIIKSFLCGKLSGDMFKVYIYLRIFFSYLFYCYDKGYYYYIE